MSEGEWPNVALGDLIERIEAGSSFRCRETPPAADEVGVAKVSAVSWGRYDEQESKTCLDASRINDELLIRKGDFLISRANTVELVGACVIAEQVSRKVMLSDKTLRLQFKDPSLKPWVLYFLRSQVGRQQIEALCTGNQDSMRNISQKSLRQITLPLAPPEQRQQILAVLEQNLSRVEATTTTLHTIQAKLKQARASILKAAVEGRLACSAEAKMLTTFETLIEQVTEWELQISEMGIRRRKHKSESTLASKLVSTPGDDQGWLKASVADVADVQLGRQRSPKNHSGEWMTPYLRAANITWEGLALEDVKSMNFVPEERERFALHDGDILLNEASGSASEVGKPAMWKGEIEQCCFQNTLLRVRTIPALRQWLLLHFMADAKSGRFSRSSKGVGIHHLSANTLSAHKIMIPPSAMQDQIVAEVERRFFVLDQVEATVNASLNRCGQLRLAVLKRAFGG